MYYFITYQAKNREGSGSIWHEVIDQTPMAFIKDMERIEQEDRGNYYDFVVLNTHEITKKEFDKYDGEF